MKKILTSFILYALFQATGLSQGRIAEIWTQPAIYKASEAVSWYFDVSGTALDGISEGIYLWSWFPSEPDAGNFPNSSDFAALTQVDGNIWRMDLTPTEYYGVNEADIFAFYGLLKNKNGSKVTDAFAPDQDPPNHIQLYNFSNIAGVEIMDYLPAEIYVNRPLSIVINTNNTWSDCETSGIQGALAAAESVHMVAGLNNWEYSVEVSAETLDQTELVPLGDGLYRMDLIIGEYFDVPEDYDYDELEFYFTNADASLKGADASCNEFTLSITDLPEIIPPELIFFPQKISSKDILTLIRTNNEPGVTGLDYYIYADGTRVSNGSFTGTPLEMKAHINLIDALKDYADLASIQLRISDNNGRTIFNAEIPLVNLNE